MIGGDVQLIKWSDNFRVVIKVWPPATFVVKLNQKKSNKKYFIKKEISIGKSKLSNIITAHLWNTQNYQSIQTKCKFHLQQTRAKTKKCQKKTSDLSTHARKLCLFQPLNMLKKQQRNLDSSFTVSHASRWSNSRYVDLNVCASGSIK